MRNGLFDVKNPSAGRWLMWTVLAILGAAVGGLMLGAALLGLVDYFW